MRYCASGTAGLARRDAWLRGGAAGACGGERARSERARRRRFDAPATCRSWPARGSTPAIAASAIDRTMNSAAENRRRAGQEIGRAARGHEPRRRLRRRQARRLRSAASGWSATRLAAMSVWTISRKVNMDGLSREQVAARSSGDRPRRFNARYAAGSAMIGTKSASLEARPADQRAIDIGHRENLGGVVGLDRPAIEDPHPLARPRHKPRPAARGARRASRRSRRRRRPCRCRSPRSAHRRR